MYQQSRLNSDLNFFQKIKNLDFILLFCITILSVLSFFIMYSTDGGKFHYHTKSHLTKLIAFFILMLAISFFNIKFWHFCFACDTNIDVYDCSHLFDFSGGHRS